MKILQLIIYENANIDLGRESYICQKFQSTGSEVLTLSISKYPYNNSNPNHLFVVNIDKEILLYDLEHCTDLAISKLSSKDKDIYDFLKYYIKSFKPNIILLEQAWLWPVIKRAITEGIIEHNKIKIVYSSHCIQHLDHKDLLKDFGQNIASTNYISDEIKALEIDLAVSADYIICANEFDLNYYQSYTNKKIILVSSGAPHRSINKIVNSGTIKEIGCIVQDCSFLLFLGCAYIPNALNFWNIFGISFMNFRPDTRILAVGGIGSILFNYQPEESSLFEDVNHHILKCINTISEEVLVTLMNKSAGFILPTTFSGGSNFKTAEAIASGKPVIATSMAVRGFDFAHQLSNFFITDDPKTFSSMASDIVSNKIKLKPISKEERVLRDSVYWNNTLLPLESLISEIRQKINTSNS